MNIYLSKSIPLYMQEYADFAANYIGLDKLRGDVFVRLCSGALSDDSYGLCWGDNYSAEIDIASKSVNEKVSREDKLKTLGHELVHAKQYLKRELLPPKYPSIYETWKGVEHKYEPHQEREMPWEVEATILEDEIYVSYIIWKKGIKGA